MRNRIPFCFNDLLVGVLLMILITTVSMVATQRARETANRAKCASNLHQIGLAILLYQQDSQQLYPETIMDASADPKPTWGTPYQADKTIGPIDNADAFTAGNKAL